MVIFSTLTLSKSAFLMLLLPLILMLYSKAKKRKYFVLLSICVVCIIFLLQLLDGRIEIFNGVLYRFNQVTNVDSLTTGRSYIWKDYLNFFLNNPSSFLLGRGLGAEVLNSHAAHNTYIDLLYYLGIIGTLFTFLVFFVLINIKNSFIKVNLLNYSILICIGLMYFFLSELFYFDWAFHFIIAFMILKMNMNQV